MHPWRLLPLVVVGVGNREQRHVTVLGDSFTDGARRGFRDWMGKGNAEDTETQRATEERRRFWWVAGQNRRRKTEAGK